MTERPVHRLPQEPEVAERARELRAQLDASFAEPREVVRPAMSTLLAIRAGEELRAVQVSELQAVLADRPITRLPTPVPELLGLCAIRGAIAPVYDLAALLGGPIHRHHAPRWIMLTQHRELVALAFDALDAQLLVPTSEIASAEGDTGQGGAVRVHGVLRPLLRIAAVLELIERRVRPLREPR
jgi:purine-binding chemotaxis protein CheW